MTIRTCYEGMDADFDEVLERLGKEERISRYAIKFLEDPNYALLQDSLKKEDYDTAFRAVHTLKGGSQNLGFSKLFLASSELTEALRGGHTEQAKELFGAVKKAYEETIFMIRQL